MPEKEKTYDRVIFTPEVIKETVDMVRTTLPEKQREMTGETFNITVSSEESWSHDTEEEFFADYRKGFESVTFEKAYGLYEGKLRLMVYGKRTDVSVTMPSRPDVERVFNILESNVEKCHLPESPPKPVQKKRRRPKIKIFIGHGHNPQWKDLKDHLHEKHKLDVEAYEIGARAGLTIKEVLEDVLTSSSFAVLVLTGEDMDAKGGIHARENVIHELGLFQGYLGWERAIALIEEDVTEFSNIHGLNQIRFSKGNIRETFGEVLATIKREFSEKE